MENKENFIRKEDQPENSLKRAYMLVHNKEPENLADWEIVQKIVEVLGDQNWIPSDLARECLYNIVHSVDYPDKDTKKNLVLMAEDAARSIFPELSSVEEVHMDQIEYLYNKWKKDKKE